MHWYRDLYVGTKAAERKSRIISRLKRHHSVKNVYVVTRASNGYDLFDIYPSAVLMQKYYRKKDLYIIGVAAGYEEALELVRQIVEDVYCRQHITEIKKYFDDAWMKEA